MSHKTNSKTYKIGDKYNLYKELWVSADSGYRAMLVGQRKFQVQKNWQSEQAMAAILDSVGIKYHRQVIINPFIADFVIPDKNMVVEVDGPHHDVRKDFMRNRYFENIGFTVVRFKVNRLKCDLEIINKLNGIYSLDANMALFRESIRRSVDTHERNKALSEVGNFSGGPRSQSRNKKRKNKRNNRKKWLTFKKQILLPGNTFMRRY